jgi:hypothetical protein
LSASSQTIPASSLSSCFLLFPHQSTQNPLLRSYIPSSHQTQTRILSSIHLIRLITLIAFFSIPPKENFRRFLHPIARGSYQRCIWSLDTSVEVYQFGFLPLAGIRTAGLVVPSRSRKHQLLLCSLCSHQQGIHIGYLHDRPPLDRPPLFLVRTPRFLLVGRAHTTLFHVCRTHSMTVKPTLPQPEAPAADAPLNTPSNTPSAHMNLSPLWTPWLKWFDGNG